MSMSTAIALLEWPRTVNWMKRLARQVDPAIESGHQQGQPVRVLWPGIPARNVLFLAIVLVDGFRRLLPPY
jgi:ADP-ribosyl-[dinitrogen reductase] hydrolase